MATENIKGISVKIGADTSDFIKQLKKVDKEINYSERQAKELQKQLELKFDETTFNEAQKRVQADLEATEQKAKALKEQMQLIAQEAGVNSDSYKKLQIELAKTDTQAVKLQKTLDDINNIKPDSFIDKIKGMAGSIKASTGAIVAATAAVTKVVKETVKYGDEVQTIADKYNLTAEAVQRWNYIALQSDVASDQLYKGMTKVRDAIGTALIGETNSSTEAISKLVGDISKLPTDTEGAFKSIIIALSQVEDSTLQAYYASEIFGERIATELIPLLKQGAENLNELNSEFDQLGALSDEEVKKLAELDNKFNKITTKVKNLTYQLGFALAPVIELIIGLLEPVIELLQQIMEWITPVINAITTLADKINTLGFATIGKGWLWGSDKDKQKLQNVFTTWGETSSYNETTNNYKTPTTNNNSSFSNYEDNSQYQFNIDFSASGNLGYDAKSLADEVIKQIVTKKQASGR